MRRALAVAIGCVSIAAAVVAEAEPPAVPDLDVTAARSAEVLEREPVPTAAADQPRDAPPSTPASAEMAPRAQLGFWRI